MKAEFVKWGKTFALRIPGALAKKIGASEGKRVEIAIESGALIIKVARASRPRRKRDRLVDVLEVTAAESPHAETDSRAPLGEHVW
jgi:antitoxin component of MazEF toxin-antitoxin module